METGLNNIFYTFIVPVTGYYLYNDNHYFFEEHETLKVMEKDSIRLVA